METVICSTILIGPRLKLCVVLILMFTLGVILIAALLQTLLNTTLQWQRFVWRLRYCYATCNGAEASFVCA